MIRVPKLKTNEVPVLAKNTDLKVPISRWLLILDVAENERKTTTTLLKCNTKEDSVFSFVASSPFLENQKMAARNMKFPGGTVQTIFYKRAGRESGCYGERCADSRDVVAHT